MKTLILSLLVVSLTACTASPTKSPTPEISQVKTEVKEAVTPAQAAKNCICVKMWMPVCGKNNKTYGNSCEADCAGVKYTQGACQEKK